MSLQTESRRVFVRPLASYNAGDLYGEWIDVDGMTGDELTDAVAEVLKNGPQPDAEEWAIHDYEGFGPIKLGEHPDLDTVAEVAEALDDHGEAYAVWYANESRDGADVERFEEQYRGVFRTLEDYAEQYLDDIGAFHGASDLLKNYFDYEKFARDLEMGGDVWTHDGDEGVHVFDNH